MRMATLGPFRREAKRIKVLQSQSITLLAGQVPWAYSTLSYLRVFPEVRVPMHSIDPSCHDSSLGHCISTYFCVLVKDTPCVWDWGEQPHALLDAILEVLQGSL